MCLVQDQGVVAQQAPVTLDLGEQDAVGHQLDQCAITCLIGKTHRVANRTDACSPICTKRGSQLVGDPLGHGARRQPSRLGVPDDAADAAPHLEADFGQLGGLAGSGFTGDHHDLMAANGGGELAAELTDRQVWVGDLGHRGVPGGDNGLGGADLTGEILDFRRTHRPAQRLQSPAQPGGVADGQTVESRAQRANVTADWFRHPAKDRRRNLAPGSAVRRLESGERPSHGDLCDRRRSGAGSSGAGGKPALPAQGLAQQAADPTTLRPRSDGQP